MSKDTKEGQPGIYWDTGKIMWLHNKESYTFWKNSSQILQTRCWSADFVIRRWSRNVIFDKQSSGTFDMIDLYIEAGNLLKDCMK